MSLLHYTAKEMSEQFGLKSVEKNSDRFEAGFSAVRTEVSFEDLQKY